MSASEVTSSTIGSILPSWARSRSPSAAFRTPAITVHPRAASAKAVARPIPRPAPVTRTVGIFRVSVSRAIRARRRPRAVGTHRPADADTHGNPTQA